MSTVKCRNCGHDAADDDGDCAQCHEPQIVTMPMVTEVTQEKPVTKNKEKKEKKSAKKSQATLLIGFCKGCEWWHTPDGVGFVSVPVGAHREHWPIKSTSFRRWLQRQYFANTKAVCNAQAVQDAIGVLDGSAMFLGDEHPAYVRLAQRNDSVYIDLCDEDWRVVEIDRNGWRVLKKSPVRFRRYKAMLSLPPPQRGGDVAELQRVLGLMGDCWILVAAWILAALRPLGPFPVLSLYAEQGAGKTHRGAQNTFAA